MLSLTLLGESQHGGMAVHVLGGLQYRFLHGWATYQLFLRRCLPLRRRSPPWCQKTLMRAQSRTPTVTLTPVWLLWSLIWLKLGWVSQTLTWLCRKAPLQQQARTAGMSQALFCCFELYIVPIPNLSVCDGLTFGAVAQGAQ